MRPLGRARLWISLLACVVAGLAAATAAGAQNDVPGPAGAPAMPMPRALDPDPALDTALDLTPPAVTTATTAHITFHATGIGATFTCALDAEPFAPCTSPVDRTGLAVGDHVFRVAAIDAAQVPDPTPASVSWTVLAAVPAEPDTTILDGPPSVTQSSAIDLRLASTVPGSTFECSLDDGPFGPCTGLPPAGVGPHRIAARAVAGGVADATPAVRTWTVELPDTIIDTAMTSPTTSSGATFTFHATSDTATFQCSRDGAVWTSCVSGHLLTGVTVGLHHFEVRARNGAGDVDPSPATADWLVVAPPPPPVVVAPPDPVVGASPPPVTAAPLVAPPAKTAPADPCAQLTGKALRLCRADEQLKTDLAACAKRPDARRTSCRRVANAIRRCAVLTGRRALACRVTARRRG